MKNIKSFQHFITESASSEMWKIIKSHKFNYYIDTVFTDDYESRLDLTVEAYIIDLDCTNEDYCLVRINCSQKGYNDIKDKIIEVTGIEPDPNISITFDLDIYNNGQIVHCDGEGNNNFASEKDFNSFLEALHKIYVMEDKETIAKLIGNISGAKLGDVEGGVFYEFVNDNFKDFEGLKATMIDVNQYLNKP